MSYPRFALGRLGEIKTGSTPSTSADEFWGGEVPFVTPSELDAGQPIIAAPRTLTLAGVNNSRLVKANAILVCCIGSLGKIGVAGRDLVTNQQINSIEFDESKVHPRYGFHACRQLKSHLVSIAPATTVPIVSKSKFAELEIPVPPPHDQLRIAAILDKAEAIRAKRREALAQLDYLTQSIFMNMFGDPVTNPKSWQTGITLGEVAEIVSGITKGRKLAGKATREIPYLAVANVQDMKLSLDTVKRIDATEDEIFRYALKDGDLLLTEGGDPDKLGRGTLWHGELAECIHQNHIFRVRLTSDKLTPHYLNWLVGSQRGKQYFLKSAKQTTGIASINMSQLRGFPLLLPPIELQREFEKSIGEVKKHRARLILASQESDGLFAALQHHAFRGEL